MGDTSDHEIDRPVIREMNVACHLAAFLADLPSKRQEIDDKLPSNSS
jgi:hypothetical protein